MPVVRTSPCCSADLVDLTAGADLVVRRCRRCGSLWGEHLSRHAGTAPWSDLEITDRFAGALRARRLRQADEILRRFPELRDGTVLDYGAGQGAFASTLLRHGLDVTACDVDVHAPGQLVAETHLAQLDAPWAIPPGWWGTVCLLDVLEHHPDPSRLAADMPGDRLLIKVPLADGPLTRAARTAARAGKPEILDALFLVGDVSPHEVLFTRRGLVEVARRGGWTLVRSKRIAEVGRELPDRLRLTGVLASAWARPLVAAAGIATATAATVWSDTEVFLFARAGKRPADGEASP